MAYRWWVALTLGQRLQLGVALTVLVGTGIMLLATPLGSMLWQLLRDPSATRLSQFLAATTMWLPLLLIGFMILHTLIPIPAEILALAAGMTLGPFWGFVTIWIGAMAGAWLGFFLARALGQPFLSQRGMTARFTRLLQQLQQADVALLIAVRLLPIVSFNLVNYALGLSPIGWWRFTWTTAVGIVPVTALVVVFGAHLTDWRLVLWLTLVAVVLGLVGYRVMRARQPVPPPQPAGLRQDPQTAGVLERKAKGTCNGCPNS